MKSIFDAVSRDSSRIVTASYSTSFSLGIRFLDRGIQDPIHGIYGFVRLADEIVDSFHDYPKSDLLREFTQDTYTSITRGISTNPILNHFQQVVNTFQIDMDLIETFLNSMSMDLHQTAHDESSYKAYILGSAEVVGLMCLKVFTMGDAKLYEQLKPNAMSLGSAFQKINFLRDLKADYAVLGRVYFPGVNLESMTESDKACIERDIEKDFDHGMEGILKLPKKARLGVYVAYIYYRSLFNKIRNTQARQIMQKRIRIPNPQKAVLFASSYLRNSLNLL